VAQQHDRIREAFSSAETSMGELDPTVVRLSRATAIEALPPIEVERTAVEWRCDRVLTLREQQILTLLATSPRNPQKAAPTEVAQSTGTPHMQRNEPHPPAPRGGCLHLRMVAVRVCDD
jgi:hypothetical protein